MYRRNLISLTWKFHRSGAKKTNYPSIKFLECQSIFTSNINFSTSLSRSFYKSLVGRDFLFIQDFTSDELKSVLWTALDLKFRFKNQSAQDSMGLMGILITSLLHTTNAKIQSNIEKATQLLGARNCTVVDKHWECSSSVIDTGRYLSNLSGAIVASSIRSEKSLNDLAAGATVPVINVGSPDGCPLVALGYALTILNAYNRLERLRVAWVGPSQSPILSSLLLLLPKLRVHFYLATEECRMQPNLEEALKLSSRHRSEIHHLENPEQAIYRANAVITTAHNIPGFQINRKLVNDAAVECIFLHDLPRTPSEVTDDVFYDRKTSLVWEAADNYLWVLMAVILKTIKDYDPKIPAPLFSED